MSSLVHNFAIICLAIDGNEKKHIAGRTKMQKLIYFVRYLDWDIMPYRLHFYGPYSDEIAEALQLAARIKIVKEAKTSPYQYSLTRKGRGFLARYISQVGNKEQIEKTKKLCVSLNRHSKKTLELTTTIDLVTNTNPHLNHEEIIDKVCLIKDNFTEEEIKKADKTLSKIKKEIDMILAK